MFMSSDVFLHLCFGKAPFHRREEKLYTGAELNAKHSFVLFFLHSDGFCVGGLL